MDSQKLFPKEFLELTVEHHLGAYSHSSRIIYGVLVVSFITLLTLLPFLFVSVSVKSPGLLRATTEVNYIKATSPGLVREVLIKENSMVRKGQLLFAVQSPTVEEKERYLKGKMEEVDRFLHDVRQLLRLSISENFNSVQLATPFYHQSLSDYRQKLIERQTRFQKAKQDFDRSKKLYSEHVIAATEFENSKFEMDKVRDDLNTVTQSQLSTWQQELRGYEKEGADNQNQLVLIRKEKENLNIKAPVSGTIQNLAGIYRGSPVFTNQDLAQISPDTSLLAEVYVSPNDIGLLRVGMRVHMQISSFNYNQWGLLHGTISEIPGDIQVTNGQPVFKVKCKPDADHLSLKNGYAGKVKKGMTLQARFMVTQRSLWQLLYDKVDDWVNPNVISNASVAIPSPPATK